MTKTISGKTLHMKKIITALLGTLCITSAAQANIVYSWHGDNNVAPYNITLQIDLTNETVASGAFKFDTRNASSPDAGLVRFYYTYPGASDGPILWQAGQGRDPRVDVVSLDLTFGLGGALSGSIHGLDFNDEIALEGTSGRFTITSATSDGSMAAAGCVHGVPCTGGTGTVTWYSYTVPEPSSLALTGLGIFALGLFARRKQII